MTEPAVGRLVDVPGDERPIDDELLEEAKRQIEAHTPSAAINEALRRLVEQERAKRRDALAHLRRMVAEGAFNFPDNDEVSR
ncbi:type II toxin-antitoxin system VapB family antitoxin [Actinoplanes sp. NPDC049596]|uniref:type II toxin-antitoxin system VapB family antitoxin n=1 Tax=unclassified Actinoplanes TaxID=2626549 RepID=UPI0034217427